MSVISDFLKDIKGKHADRKYSEARIDGKPLKEWLTEQQPAATEPVRRVLKRIDAVLENAQKASKRRGAR
ncbi:MAG: hypothetical protein IPK19_25075 [Chloroflexi bacterium]|nr:hypothetical protein [Chloroflexota bacterium]